MKNQTSELLKAYQRVAEYADSIEPMLRHEYPGKADALRSRISELIKIQKGIKSETR